MVIPENTIMASTIPEDFHKLSDKWTLWAHLPHDIDWSISSYKRILDMTTVEETIAITETLPDILVKNCMLFIITP